MDILKTIVDQAISAFTELRDKCAQKIFQPIRNILDMVQKKVTEMRSNGRTVAFDAQELQRLRSVCDSDKEARLTVTVNFLIKVTEAYHKHRLLFHGEFINKNRRLLNTVQEFLQTGTNLVQELKEIGIDSAEAQQRIEKYLTDVDAVLAMFKGDGSDKDPFRFVTPRKPSAKPR